MRQSYKFSYGRVQLLLGRVESYLLDKMRVDGAIHLTLIDPEKTSPKSASRIARIAESCGTAAIMVGGSTVVLTSHLDTIVKAIKKTTSLPLILFPNNITGISRYADAIWFMSLLNSSDPYFIMGAQVLGAPAIKKFDLEALPLGYVIVGENSAASIIGRAIPIPYDKPEIVVAHALTAMYLGMRFVYLEAGSGANKPVPTEMIKLVKKSIKIPLIIGGGIKTKRQVKEIVRAGGDIIVTGTVVEDPEMEDEIREMVNGIKAKT